MKPSGATIAVPLRKTKSVTDPKYSWSPSTTMSLRRSRETMDTSSDEDGAQLCIGTTCRTSRTSDGKVLKLKLDCFMASYD